MSTAAAPASAAAYAIAAAVLAGTVGFFVGQASALGSFGRSGAQRRGAGGRRTAPKKSWPNNYDVDVHPDSSDEELMARLRAAGAADPDEDKEGEESESEDEDEVAGDLAAFPGNTEECKLVLVVRTDLGMGKGKIAAQCSHATLACYTHLSTHAPDSPLLRRWYTLGQAKVAVQCKSEDEMMTLQAQALSLGLCARTIRDQGRTQIPSGTTTVLGVGPGPKSVVDQVTGSLKLL